MSELRCAAVKNLLLVLPTAAAAFVPPGHIGSTCAASVSLVTRPASIGATSGWLRGIWTKDGAVSSSSLSSSTILTSRRRLGAWLVEPWPFEGSAAVPARIASVEDGSTVIGLFPATLSSVVGAGRLWSSSLLVYWKHPAALTAGGSTPAGWSIPGASDTYTAHRSISPIYNTKATSHQSKATVFNSITNKPRFSFTLGVDRPSLKACIRSSLQTKLLSARLNNSFILWWISDFPKLSRCILVGSWLHAYSYAKCTLLWQGITRRARKFPTTPGPSRWDQSIRLISSDN